MWKKQPIKCEDKFLISQSSCNDSWLKKAGLITMIELQSTNRKSKAFWSCALLFSNGGNVVFNMLPNTLCFGLCCFSVLFHSWVICPRTLKLWCSANWPAVSAVSSTTNWPAVSEASSTANWPAVSAVLFNHKTDQRFQKPVQRQTDQWFQKPVQRQTDQWFQKASSTANWPAVCRSQFNRKLTSGFRSQFTANWQWFQKPVQRQTDQRFQKPVPTANWPVVSEASSTANWPSGFRSQFNHKLTSGFRIQFNHKLTSGFRSQFNGKLTSGFPQQFQKPVVLAEPLDKCAVADYEQIQCGQPGISVAECEAINCCFNGQQLLLWEGR